MAASSSNGGRGSTLLVRPSVTRVGVVFSFSLCLVSSAYMLYLQKYENVDFKKDAKNAVEDFSLFEIFPAKSPFGDNWPFTPIEAVKPHPRYKVNGELQSSTINDLQSGKVSLANMFLPPSWRTPAAAPQQHTATATPATHDNRDGSGKS